MRYRTNSKQSGFAPILGLLLAALVIAAAASSYIRSRQTHNTQQSQPTTTPVFKQGSILTPHPTITPAPGASSKTPIPTATPKPGTTTTPLQGHSPGYITQDDNGSTFQVTPGQKLHLDLSTKQWNWDYPIAKPNIVGISKVYYDVDPGFAEWSITTNTPGTVTISTTGNPHCATKPEAACPDSLSLFKVTLVIK